MKGALAGFAIGPALLAIGESAALPPDIEVWMKAGGVIATVTAAVLTSKHLAERAQRAAEAADQRASAVGAKVDTLRVDLHDLEGIVIELKTERKTDHEEIEKLRAQRHDYIDKELSPRLLRHEEFVEDKLEQFGARLAVAEALARQDRS